MKKKYPIILFLLLCFNTIISLAQTGELLIELNKSRFEPGDEMNIKATQPVKKGAIATLFLIAEHEEGMVWEMRWPMIKGICEPNLRIPDSLPQGRYRFHFSVLQNLFTVFGKVKSPTGIDVLNSTLITSKGDIYDSETPVNTDGSFTYKNVLFQDEATIIFGADGKRKNTELDIEISTILDSSLTPGAGKSIDVFIGFTPPLANLPPFISLSINSNADAQILEAVTVVSKPINRGELFNKKYSNGLFKDMNERVINLLDDPTLNNAFTVLQIVRMKNAGINFTGGMNPVVRWRGDLVSFYVDEIRTTATDIETIPISNIAIIKVYPPPFFGNQGGFGGAVAVYTRRGGIDNENYKNAFKVKGYTALSSVFPVQPDRL
ncbi:MAG: hypothetical protein WEA59_08975 [Ferruginibacter sp.]